LIFSMLVLGSHGDDIRPVINGLLSMCVAHIQSPCLRTTPAFIGAIEVKLWRPLRKC
jgi:hypothetical protein